MDVHVTTVAAPQLLVRISLQPIQRGKHTTSKFLFLEGFQEITVDSTLLSTKVLFQLPAPASWPFRWTVLVNPLLIQRILTVLGRLIGPHPPPEVEQQVSESQF